MHCVVISGEARNFSPGLLDALRTQIDSRETLCYAGDRLVLQEHAMKNGYKAMDSDMHVNRMCPRFFLNFSRFI